MSKDRHRVSVDLGIYKAPFVDSQAPSSGTMANSLAGKKIVIVGGTSGMGFAVAKFSLLDHAGEVIVASSKKDNVDGAVARLNAIIAEHKLSGKVEGAVVDAGNAESIKALMMKVGELDHLVWTAMGDISKGFPGNNPDEQRGE